MQNLILLLWEETYLNWSAEINGFFVGTTGLSPTHSTSVGWNDTDLVTRWFGSVLAERIDFTDGVDPLGAARITLAAAIHTGFVVVFAALSRTHTLFGMMSKYYLLYSDRSVCLQIWTYFGFSVSGLDEAGDFNSCGGSCRTCSAIDLKNMICHKCTTG